MIAWKLFRQMKVIYKKDIIDKILEEIETANSLNDETLYSRNPYF